MKTKTQYYNLWRIDSNRWTNAHTPGCKLYAGQNPKQPMLLTKEQCETWIAGNWNPEAYEIRELPDDYEEIHRAKKEQELDQARRLAHAMKYL